MCGLRELACQRHIWSLGQHKTSYSPWDQWEGDGSFSRGREESPGSGEGDEKGRSYLGSKLDRPELPHLQHFELSGMEVPFNRKENSSGRQVWEWKVINAILDMPSFKHCGTSRRPSSFTNLFLCTWESSGIWVIYTLCSFKYKYRMNTSYVLKSVLGSGYTAKSQTDKGPTF